MDYRTVYEDWSTNNYFDESCRKELLEIANDDAEIKNRFSTFLDFGTGGLRGLIGAGTNRMNIYTVRLASQGLSNYLNSQNLSNSKCGSLDTQLTTEAIKVAIAYDNRRYSKEFAFEAAKVLSKNGIMVFLYDGLRPSPQLSYTVRELKCIAGIVITASHNPSGYNGYKIYDSNGVQITNNVAAMISYEISKLSERPVAELDTDKDCGNKTDIVIIGNKLDLLYRNQVKNLANRKGTDMRIVYSSLHGTGLLPITLMLRELGYTNVEIVEKQADYDSSFVTVTTPNPESLSAYDLAIEKANFIDAEMILATDPDCDRIGVMCRNKDGNFELLTGNQIGALLISYLTMSGVVDICHGLVIKTIVTSDFGGKIAFKNNLCVIETLTGFKYIGELMAKYDLTNEFDFVFGYEESCGYLLGDFVRDKDAVIACLLIVEMTSWYKEKGQTLFSALQLLFEEFNYYEDFNESMNLTECNGNATCEDILQKFRDPSSFKNSELKLCKIEDYENQVSVDYTSGLSTKLEFQSSKVVKVYFDEDSWLAVRPSGTEPILKFYYSANAKTERQAKDILVQIKRLKEHIIQLNA